VARVGADAFGVLIREGSPEDPMRAAVRLQAVLATPLAPDEVSGAGDGAASLRHAGAGVQVTASAVVFPARRRDARPEVLLGHADLMLARERAAGAAA
jgi:GGDEF domain-containing protein